MGVSAQTIVLLEQRDLMLLIQQPGADQSSRTATHDPYPHSDSVSEDGTASFSRLTGPDAGTTPLREVEPHRI